MNIFSRALLVSGLSLTAALVGANSASAAVTPTTVSISSGGVETPAFMTNFPSRGASDRSLTVRYEVGSARTGCRRLAISSPASGVTVRTNASGQGASDLALAASSVTDEIYTVSLTSAAVVVDSVGLNVTVACSGGYVNSLPLIIGRVPALELSVNGSQQDQAVAVTVPSSGSVSKSFTLSYKRLGMATGCSRDGINPSADPAGAGITSNLTAARSIDNVSAESLSLTFAPGSLASGYSLPITASCAIPASGGNPAVPLTPVYRRVLVLRNGIELGISMADRSTGAPVTGGITVDTIPTVGTYTAVFPLTYAIGSGATNCRRLPVSSPSSGIEISSSSAKRDDLMFQRRDLSGVRREDVTVHYLNPVTPQEYKLVITIACDNTTPAQQSFAINLKRQQVGQVSSIDLSYNGKRSEDGVLVSGDLLSLPMNGQAISRTFQLDWTVPTGATGCVVYREEADRLSGVSQSGPQAVEDPAAVVGSDPYSFAGIPVNGSGVDPNFTITLSASDLMGAQTTARLRYALYCSSDPDSYDSVDVVFSRYIEPTDASGQCFYGVEVLPAPVGDVVNGGGGVSPAPTAATTSPTEGSPTPSPSGLPTASPTATSTAPSGLPTASPTATAATDVPNGGPKASPVPFETAVPFGSFSNEPLALAPRRLGAIRQVQYAQASNANDLGYYEAPSSSVNQDTVYPVSATMPIVQYAACGERLNDNSGGEEAVTPVDPSGNNGSGEYVAPSGGWNYSQGSRLWSR